MKSCYQFRDLNIVGHGLSVWRYTNRLLNSDTEGMRIPQWYSEFKDQILDHLHDRKTIKHYNIWHDCGKPACRIVDAEGKQHFPDHAEISKRVWSEHFSNEVIGNLIGLDMIMHVEDKQKILARKLPVKDAMTLLITALAEIHANSEMFGGIDTTSFKIKWKKIDKLGRALCLHYFNHPYMYIILRKDLSQAQKTVQCTHAGIEATRAFVKPGDEHPSVIVCEVRSEDKLKKIMAELDGKVEYRAFREPDIDDQFTALASAPIYGNMRKLFSRFQLIR
jgi:hypothetical protein